MRTTPQATATVIANDDGTNSGAVTGTASDGDAPFSFVWTDGNGNVVGTTEDVTGLPAGEYTLLITDANGCTATTTVLIDNVSSVSEKVFPGTFNAFPNPTTDFLNLEIKLNTSKDFNWKIYNGQGQLMKISANGLNNSVFEKIDISNLASGIYMLTVSVENERFFKKIIVE